jgi:hypothetical protein
VHGPGRLHEGRQNIMIDANFRRARRAVNGKVCLYGTALDVALEDFANSDFYAVEPGGDAQPHIQASSVDAFQFPRPRHIAKIS